MTDYRNQLKYYGFSKNEVRVPNWATIANRLNIYPTGTYDANNKNSYQSKQYAKAVKSALTNKYKTGTEKVSQTFSFNFKRKYKNQTGFHTATKTISVNATRDTIDETLLNRYMETIDQIEQDSPYEAKDFGDIEPGEITKIPLTSGGRIIHSNIRIARMRHGRAFNLDRSYLGDTSWDRNAGTCVFDWLYHAYKDISGFKKYFAPDRETAYEKLHNDMRGSEDPDLIEEGCDVENIKKFCQKFNVRMYAYDKHEKLIEHYKPENPKRDALPLIYIVSGNHFYPIIDKDKRVSLCATVREDRKQDEERWVNWKSNDYLEEKKAETKETEYEIVCPDDDDDTDPNSWAIQKIHEANTLPADKSIYIDGANIASFTIGNTKYFTEPINKGVVEYCDDNGMAFQGQSSASILVNLWKECYGEEQGLGIGAIESRFNPETHKILSAPNIKYRTHYGATRDLTEYITYCPAEYDYVDEEHLIEVKDKKKVNTLAKYFDGVMEAENIQKIGDKYYEKVKTKKAVQRPSKYVMETMLEDKRAVCVDINKCYSSLLQNPLDNWLRYDIEDEISLYTEHQGDLPTGLYFVETEDLTLLHQTNWYSNKIIDLAIKEGIELKIKYQLVHKIRFEGDDPIPKEYFHPLLQLIQERTGGKPFYKILNNMITGYMGKTHKTDFVAEIDTDPEQVFRCFMNCETPDDEGSFERLFFKPELKDSGYTRWKRDDVFIHTLTDAENRKAFLYGYERHTALNEHKLPIYLQILDWSNMKLYLMGKEVGGEVVYRKTDCLVSIGGKYPETESDEWGTYRKSEWENLKWKSMMRADRHTERPSLPNAWRFHSPNDSDDWENIIKLAIDGGGLLICGRAGTGKSYIPKSAFGKTDAKPKDPYNQKPIWELGKDVATMSFTNKASRGIFGTTIHKLLKITGDGSIPKKQINSLKKYKAFVIDEIGMIGNYLWKLLMLLKKVNPRAVFILMGDYRQLPPIEEGRIGEADIFNHPVVRFLCNNNKIELTVKKRYEQELWDFLERGYEEGNWKGLEQRKITYEEVYSCKNICYFNKTRDYINDLANEHYASLAEYTFHLPYERKGEKDRASAIWIYEGLPVMSYKNNNKLNIVNSEEFMVVSFTDENITLMREEEGEEVEVSLEDFHKYFLCNYASTAHKSQGATYHSKVILWNWNRMTADQKVAYTACSRATNINNLIVSQGLISEEE